MISNQKCNACYLHKTTIAVDSPSETPPSDSMHQELNIHAGNEVKTKRRRVSAHVMTTGVLGLIEPNSLIKSGMRRSNRWNLLTWTCNKYIKSPYTRRLIRFLQQRGTVSCQVGLWTSQPGRGPHPLPLINQPILENLLPLSTRFS